VGDQGLKIGCFGEGARDERLQSYLGLVAVDLDAEAEGVVDLTAELGVGGGERVVEVGQPVEDGAGVVEVESGSSVPVVVSVGDRQFDLLTFGFEGADAVAVTECVGGLVAVADAVAAGLVGVALAGPALHAQGVVAGGTVNDSAST